MPTYFLGRSASAKNVVGVHPAQGDLGGADQAEVGIRDRIDLRLLASRVEPDPFEDRNACEVGGDDRREAVPDERGHRELLQREIEEHGVVFEEVEPVARDFATAFEIDEVERLANLDVVFRLEVENARGADFAEFEALVFGVADRGVGVGEVRYSRQELLNLLFQNSQGFFGGNNFCFVILAVRDEDISFFGIFFPAHCLSH